MQDIGNYVTVVKRGDVMDSYGLKNRVRISNAVDKLLWEQLRKLSDETMVPMSKLLDKGIELVIQEYKKSAK